MNVSDHLQFFIQEMKRRNFSQNTIDNYASCLKVFFEKSPKDHPKNITEKDIREFLGSCSGINTQRNYHSAIKKFYDVCLGQKNKFKYIPYARKSHKLPVVLSVDEVQAMFSACENLKHKVILALLYSAGLRVSELINLKWCHIDRSRMIINLIGAKGNKDRQVMLAEDLVPLLENYYRQYKPKEYVLNGQFPGKDLRYTEGSVGRVVKQLAAKAGIKKRVYTHLLRHCSFTHMVEEGTDLSLVQLLAGHSNIKTTRIYAHISHTRISKIKSPLAGINLKRVAV